jgi:hypothetical protein
VASPVDGAPSFPPASGLLPIRSLRRLARNQVESLWPARRVGGGPLADFANRFASMRHGIIALRRNSRSYAGATDGRFGTISVPTYHQRMGDTDGSPDSRHSAARRS